MLTLDFLNLGTDTKTLNQLADRIPDYLKRIEAREQDFYKIVDDTDGTEAILDFAKQMMGRFEDVVVLGIGGSALGTICLRDSLEVKGLRLHVIDNIDPWLISEVEGKIDLKKTLFLVVTKSGGTPETLAQYFYFKEKCKKAGLKEEEHFVFITDPQKGFLRQIADNENVLTFPIPEKVGGRFSVLTSVGLVPAALMGLDVNKLLKGARNMRDRFLSPQFEENLPFQLAATQFSVNKLMHVLFPYSQRLIKLADWYRQLLAESIGKKPNVGLTPLYALGATDQHSQLQLYSEGPNDKFFMFIGVEDLGPNLEIPVMNDPSVDYLKGVTFNELLKSEMRGTIQALTEKKRPSLTLSIPRVDEETLGGLFMLFEASVAFLGEFYGINAFDQPGVERSKILTKEFLKSRS